MFNLRTRSLNNLLFNFIMIPAPLCLAWVMDSPKIGSRRTRGFAAVSVVGLITMGALGGLLGWITNQDVNRNNPAPGLDWTDSGFGAGVVLYILFGIVDACFQIIVQWTLGSLTNDPVLCARYAGAFKGTVSLGMCIAFTLDSKAVSYKTQVIIQLVLYAVALCCLFYVIYYYVEDTKYFKEENVIVPAAVEENLVIAGKIPRSFESTDQKTEGKSALSKDVEDSA
jgi:hypothetical protein